MRDISKSTLYLSVRGIRTRISCPKMQIGVTESEQMYRTVRSRLLPRGLWGLFSAKIQDGVFRFQGFAIPPQALPMRLRFFVNEIEAEVAPQFEIDPGIPLIAARFGLPEPPTAYGFSASIAAEQLGSARTLRIEFRPGSGLQLSPYQDWYVPLDIGLQADTARRVRVSGTTDEVIFETLGASSLFAISRALREYFGRKFADCAAILDWGCGCGRVARFLANEAPNKLVGIDIDADNIGW